MKTSVRKDKNQSVKQSVFTAETLGVVLVLFSALALVCLITGDKIFSTPGGYIRWFLLGCFGFFAYPVLFFAVFRGVMLVLGKKIKIPFKRKLLFFLEFLLLAILVHAITMHGNTGLSYGEYLAACYNRAEGGFASASGGGVLTGLIAYVFTALLTDAGAYVILGILLAVTGYFIYRDFAKDKVKVKAEKPVGSYLVEEEESVEPDKEETNEIPASPASVAPEKAEKPKQRLFVADSSAFDIKTKKDLKNDSGETLGFSYAKNGLGVASPTYTATYADDMQSKLNYIKTPAKLTPESINSAYSGYASDSKGTFVSEPIPAAPEKSEEDLPVIPLYEHDESASPAKDDAVRRAESFAEKYADLPDDETPENLPEETETFTGFGYGEENFDFNEEKEEEKPSVIIPQKPTERRARDFFAAEKEKEPLEKAEGETAYTSRVAADNNAPAREEPIKPVKEIPPINREYFRPPFDLLETYAPPADKPKENHEERMEIIRRTLEEFHISAEPQSYIEGPTITRYELKVSAGVNLNRVLNCADNLQMRLAAKNGVRILAPIPGKDLIGIEVANANKITVGLRSVMENCANNKGGRSALMFALGKSLVGEAICDNLASGPHYLVAGGSGSGKSVCLNVMITSLLMRYSPEDMRLILIDPKKVEFSQYDHIPHLMADEIMTDTKKILASLTWAYEEMERRYETFRKMGVRDLESYNEEIASDTVARMARIVIIVDELADLMQTCKKDIEPKLCLLAQKARAAGIHLVLATQRPSVDVIPGTIKVNLQGRIALKVMNFNDSQTILSEIGAEKLLGNGDMLYKSGSVPNTERYQGAFISSREIKNVVKFIIEHNKAYFDDDFKQYLEDAVKPKQEETPVSSSQDEGEMNEANSELFIKAVALAINSGSISISQVQRRFQVGYIRAAGFIDKMEECGYISPSEGSKSRKVYITREQFEEKYGPMSDL